MKSVRILGLLIIIALSACQNGVNKTAIQEETEISEEAYESIRTLSPTQQATPTPREPTRVTQISSELEALLPPKLAWDFYPNGVTRNDMLAQLPNATQVAGHIRTDEIWSGVIHVTGDVQVEPDVTLSIEPGTLILIAAGSDDQHSGIINEPDPFNPKDLILDTTKLVHIEIRGNFYVNGTIQNPVIFTSDSETPADYDWDAISLAEGSVSEINGAIIEFSRSFYIASSDSVLSKSILRNMQQSINMRMLRPDDTLEKLLEFSPVITENYIYNMGRIAVGITGSPEISNNVIIGRYDLESKGWEHGAIGGDIYTCPNIHHNYLDGGLPQKYDDYIYGEYFPFTQPSGAIIHSTCITFEYNTVIGSPLAIESHPGPWLLEHNNIMPFPSTGDAEGYLYWHDDSSDVCCLVFFEFEPEPNDKLQIEFIEKYGNIETQNSFTARNNYWGTDEAELIEECIFNEPDFPVYYWPFEEEFIEEALPNWEEFNWQ